MKKTFLILIVFLVSCKSIYCQTEEMLEKIREAVQLMDEGMIDESISLLKETVKTDPECYMCRYELAYAYYLGGDYRQAIGILKKLEKSKGVEDLLYQMMGNSYDYMGNRKKAIKTYEAGLKKFPESGKLYLELGIIQIDEKDYNKALDYFEKGIEVEPAFPSNYYWTSKLFCYSKNEVWGMIYGEIFLNLERNTKRTSEISKLLFDTYKSKIVFNATSISVSFSMNTTIYVDPANIASSFEIPYGVGIYEPTLLLSVIPVKSITLGSLDTIRSSFIDRYYEKGYDRLNTNVLFDYQKQVKDAGHFEAYNYWILMEGDPDELEKWYGKNEDKWDQFVLWFNDNQISINKTNAFHRRKTKGIRLPDMEEQKE